MIPKIIHYCWFGGGPMPELAFRCIESWKEMLPGYEIRRWDENSFDFNICNYTKEAYSCKKWAFVSDYARFYVLEKYGGLYFDTDLELLKPIDDVVNGGSFIASESRYYPGKDSVLWTGGKRNNGMGAALNPGLGIGVMPHDPMIRAILANYNKDHFVRSDGTMNDATIVDRVSRIFARKGYDPFLDEVQNIADFNIYPPRYFGGINNETRKQEITEDTRAIHHYKASWATGLDKLVIASHKAFKGKGKAVYYLGTLLCFPLSLAARSRKDGFKGAFKYYYRRAFLRKR